MSKGDDGVSTNNHGSNKKTTKKLDFFALYEEMESDNPDLKTNKMFWSRKGNSQKYTCSLCNISVQMSPNINLVKTSILAHIKDKHHKKRFEAHSVANSIKNKDSSLCESFKNLAAGNIADKSSEPKDLIEKTCDANSLHNAEDEKRQADGNNKNKELVDIDTIYQSFEKCNPVIKTSKQFLIKHKEGRHYICTLCNVLVFNSLNANEFRYNLWVHLNENNHRKMLPNFKEVKNELKKVVQNLHDTLPKNFTDDIEYLKIGPVFRFVKCAICQIAVSVNLHRLANHIESEDHQQRKLLKEQGKEKQESLPNRTRDAFRKLVVKVDDNFKKDIKYIQIGKMPGYVICSLCTYVILPTQYYLQTHFESPVHVNNKKNSIINKHAKFKVRLEDLMKTLPEDFQDYNIFEENMCGLTCKRCQESIPATSYDLYSHIYKERQQMM